MIGVEREPNERCLIDNPIVYQLRTDNADVVTFKVSVESSVVYEGTMHPTGASGKYYVYVAISELLRPYMKEVIAPHITFVGPTTFSYIDVDVEFTQGGTNLSRAIKVYPGGVSKPFLRYLDDNNTDIFNYKMMDYTRNFFMTTRTNGRHIVMRESEVMPLFYIGDDNNRPYIITEHGREYHTMIAPDYGKIYAYTFNMLNEASDGFKKSAYYAIYVGDDFVCDITIKQSAKIPHRYLIEFINSYGVRERIEVSGKKTAKPSFEKDNAYERYDSVIDDYVEKNERLGLREVIQAESGYKSIEEFFFLRDMLQSSRRWIVDAEGNKHEVRITIDNFQHDMHPDKPGSVSFSIRAIDEDIAYSPAIDNSLPEFTFGQGVWPKGLTEGYGLLYEDKSPLNTI